MKKAIIIVLDGVGLNKAPDAALYNDEDSATLPHTAEAIGGLELPNLGKLGLGNLDQIIGTPPCDNPTGAFGKLFPASAGKDSTTGHWELAGLITREPFPTYPNGFPLEVIDRFEEKIGRGILGNVVASGTEIIQRLGQKHLETGFPIVYTSADSVFQIAAHNDIVPIGLLYDWCRIARKILSGKHGVSRVIARPFVGSEDNFIRTPERRDFSLPPQGPTLLTKIERAGLPVVSVGKIKDLFAGEGITHPVFTHSNAEGIEKTIELIEEYDTGLIFTNLVDFDMLWGHRNDPRGLANGLIEFDKQIPAIQQVMGDEDIVCITADHGNDPVTPSTDHSREIVPLIIWGRNITPGRISDRETFADLGQTIAEFLGVEKTIDGSSFLSEFIKKI